MFNNLTVKLSHIALLVTNLNRAKDFYSNILGLVEIERPEFFIQGLWYELGDIQLHLMLYEDTVPVSIHSLCETIQPHFAMTLNSDVFECTIQQVKAAGIKLLDEVEEDSIGIKQAFFYDPDCSLIEINAPGKDAKFTKPA